MHRLIQAEHFEDDRGVLRAMNSFDMSEIVRCYEIEPRNITITRGWQGHRYEKKWFYCLNVSFEINLVKVNDFVNPNKRLKPDSIMLNEIRHSILSIGNKMATAIKATQVNSRLLVFSNFTLEQSKKDDYRFPIETWQIK